MTKITGTELVSAYEKMLEEGKTKSEICRSCGYVSTKEDGTERIHFTDFYTEILNAKGISMPEETEEEEDEFYNKLCEEYSQEAVDAFIELFSENDLEAFKEAYWGEYDSEADFAESFYDDLGETIPYGLVIDWEATWYSYLRHDYYFQDGFVFRNNW